MSAPAHPSRTRAEVWKLGLAAVARVLLTLAVLLAVYYLLPLDDALDVSLLAWLAAALALLGALAVFEVRSILSSPLPGMKAIEALATVIPLLLIVFAATYYVMSEVDPSNFSESLSRTDALYFVVTVFSTVGFGDITAASATARGIVTLQMVLNLVVVGLGLRVVLGAVQHSRDER